MKIYHLCISAILFILFVSCVHYQKEIGKWWGTGKTSTLEFKGDGSFITVDNMGIIASGKYSLDDNGNAKFEIIHQGVSIETITARITIQGDQMTIKFTDTGEVEIYRKER